MTSNMIPIVDLRRQYESIRSELEEAVVRAMASGHYILGAEVEAFEAEFAAYLGVKHGVAVGSGTEAIRLTVQALKLKPDDEVITVSYTAVPTVAAILAGGASPVFVDIDRSSYVMDVSKVEAAITRRTKAIVPVHLFGQAVDMDPLLALAERHGLVIIEDACQAHGTEYRGRKAGSLGLAGCFSFYPTKNLAAMGDGGMVTTNDAELAKTLRLLRNHGQRRRFDHVTRSLNSRFDDIQAAILRVKLRHLDAWNARRRALARTYNLELGGLPLLLPAEAAGSGHVYHLYAVHVQHRTRVRDRLAARGVASDIHYPRPVHLQPAYRNLGWPRGSLPASEWAAGGIVTLPLYPELTDAEAAQVIDAVKAALMTDLPERAKGARARPKAVPAA